MAWHDVILYFHTLLNMWLLSQASSAVDVNCWWDKALPLGQNVSLVCQARRSSCGPCQLSLITSTQIHPLPCDQPTDTLSISVPAEHRGQIRCKLECLSNTAGTCNVSVTGDYPPASPSRPDCSIENSEEDILCSWTRSNTPMIPTIYILHWHHENFENMSYTKETDSESGVISRTDYMKNTDIKVWVTARNMLGHAQSQYKIFNTGHITRPNPPYSFNHTSHPLEISWIMDCDVLGLFGMRCQVRYQAFGDMDWIEVDDYQVSFLLEEPRPFTEYRFRVRCHCGDEEEIMSHWSSEYIVRAPPAAPVGKLDLWTDCTPNSNTSLCNIFWKEMPLSQARGLVNDYVVTVKLDNGTENTQVTRQRRDIDAQHYTSQGCGHLRHFPLQLGVMEVFVSANTSMGMSDPTFMVFPVMSQTTPEVNLGVTGVNQTLLVHWSVPARFSERVLEYVVQHVSVEPYAQCLDWVRVNSTQRSVTLTGQFRNYTAYNVSLFAVINNHSTFLKSDIAYTIQGLPPKVQEFHVKNISHFSVTLIWSPIPVHESKGVILHYLVRLNKTEVNVSSDRTSVLLSDLHPAQQYQAWVSAVTAAGEGVRSSTTFKTDTTDTPGILIPVLVTVLTVLLIIIAFFSVLRIPLDVMCCAKIPDPINSKSFKHANFQHVWPGLFSLAESALKISELEIVENLVSITPAEPLETQLDLPDLESQQVEMSDGVHRKIGNVKKRMEESEKSMGRSVSENGDLEKDYSQMIDTDAEDGGGDEEEEDEWEEQNCVSDYERHFMPSVETI